MGTSVSNAIIVAFWFGIGFIAGRALIAFIDSKIRSWKKFLIG